MRITQQVTPQGVILFFALEDEDLADMKTRDRKGNFNLIYVDPPGGKPIILARVVLRRILKDEVVKMDSEEKRQKSEEKRAARIRKLSPCCGNKMIHDEDDPEGIMRCTICGGKYKNVSGGWFSVKSDPGG